MAESKSERFTLRVSTSDLARWVRQANREGRSVSSWLTHLANGRIRSEGLPEAPPEAPKHGRA